MPRLNISPEVLVWARQRSGVPTDALERKFRAYGHWEAGEGGPTFAQLESLAGILHLPIGMFFLPSPPDERLPLPDFRRMADVERQHPSTELIDTIQACQSRQSWFREYMSSLGEQPLWFSGSASETDSVEGAAAQIRETVGLEVGSRAAVPNWSEFLRLFVRLCQEAGILVMINGIAGNNTRRKLDPREFRGFALADRYAPLIFINGADTKAAQIFTLAHELAHIWLGESGISLPTPDAFTHENRTERWCNAVAAEILVPLDQLRRLVVPEGIQEAMDYVARTFRVSTLVALRRLAELDRLTTAEFRQAYQNEVTRLVRMERRSSSGSDFYNTMNVRVDRRFATAVISSAIEGRTMIGDAMALLNISRTDSLKREARELGLSL